MIISNHKLFWIVNKNIVHHVFKNKIVSLMYYTSLCLTSHPQESEKL